MFAVGDSVVEISPIKINIYGTVVDVDPAASAGFEVIVSFPDGIYRAYTMDGFRKNTDISGCMLKKTSIPFPGLSKHAARIMRETLALELTIK